MNAVMEKQRQAEKKAAEKARKQRIKEESKQLAVIRKQESFAAMSTMLPSSRRLLSSLRFQVESVR